MKPGLWLLPSGATVANAGMGPVLREPSAYPKRRLEAQRLYWTTRLAKALAIELAKTGKQLTAV